MDMLKFHTQELSGMEAMGARYVVVACHGSWRDGLVTNNRSDIPKLQRELRKRFMSRLDGESPVGQVFPERYPHAPRERG
jgi:hypothetical protein